MPSASKPQAIEKALKINLDTRIYGTLVEIGAGQEVARNFFQAGAAAGTIAKTMSAYDMQVSDAIYGKEHDRRYVTQSRVTKMIEREYDLVVERLARERTSDTCFFSFADTVAAKSFKGTGECHGWMGIKFHHEPNEEPSQIVLHVRMLDGSNPRQQEALGILGVNLIFGAFYYSKSPEVLIESLLDEVGWERIEVDMVQFEGACFKHIDNRLMNLHLVKKGISRSVLFTSKGDSIQAADLLYKKNIILLRGTFRPVTNIHMDAFNSGEKTLMEHEGIDPDETVRLTEISMSKLLNEGEIDSTDFLGRVDTLCALGFNVQISNFTRLFTLKDYLSQFTRKKIFAVLGVRKLTGFFDHKYYTDTMGGILEAMGTLFSGGTKLYVYPSLDSNGNVITADNTCVSQDMKHLFLYLARNNQLIPIQHFDPEILKLSNKGIDSDIREDNGLWESKIPDQVVRMIKENHLFGYNSD